MKKYFISLTICFLIYSCKSYSQDLSLDEKNYYGTWQLQTRDKQDELKPTDNYYIFNSDGTVIEKSSGTTDSVYKFVVEKIADPNHAGKFYSNLLLIDINDPTNTYSYAPDLIFDNSDNKFYLNLEYEGAKYSTYMKIK